MVAAIHAETDTPQTASVPPMLRAAGAALVAGDAETAAASLWQAVAEAASAAAQKRGWPCAGENAIRQTILQLDRECADRRPLMPMLLTAEALRPPAGSLCHLGRDGLLAYAPEVTKLVIRLLESAGADYRRAVCARMTDAAVSPAHSPPEYLAASEQAFAIGDHLEWAANLWLAVRGATASQKHGLPHNYEGSFLSAMRQLEPGCGHQDLQLEYGYVSILGDYVNGHTKVPRYSLPRFRARAVDLARYLMEQEGEDKTL